MNEQFQELASGSAYLLLQAIDSLYSVEYRIGLLDKAAKMVNDLRDELVREMAGLDGTRRAATIDELEGQIEEE